MINESGVTMLFIDQFINGISSIEFRRNEPMHKHTTFKVGGNADVVLFPKTIEETITAIKACRDFSVPYVIIGNGSNLLVADSGWRGTVIITKKMQGITRDGSTVIAEGGAMLSKVATFAAEQYLDGMAWAHGIPGTAGGGVKMNGGAYDGCMQDIVTGVDALNDAGEVVHFTAQECAFAYRDSVFLHNNHIILRVYMQLKPGDKATILARMEELQAKRKNSQPLEYPSGGSYFKRPPGYYAAALIDECGLKGYRVGDAQVSEKHAGFVINRGNATCAELLELEAHVKAIVLREKGVALECEVQKIGV